MATGKSVAERIARAKERHKKVIARAAKIEARLAPHKVRLDLVVAKMNDLEARKSRLRARGHGGDKIAMIDDRLRKLAAKKAKIERRAAPGLARLDKLRGPMNKHAETILRLGGG
jgi:hypothetical protein